MKCVICGESFKGEGNNPWPVAFEGVCCDECNYGLVLAARIAGLRRARKEQTAESKTEENK